MIIYCILTGLLVYYIALWLWYRYTDSRTSPGRTDDAPLPRNDAFIGKEDGVDGILLRTDIARHPTVLKHILLHELAHIFCIRNELDGDNFYEQYCMETRK